MENDGTDLRSASYDISLARAVLDNAPNNLALLLAKDGTVLDLNPSMAAALNRPMAQIKGALVWEFFDPERRASRRARIEQVVASGKPLYLHDTEFNGKWYNWCLAPCFGEQRDVTAVWIVAWDITERKSAESASWERVQEYRLLFDWATDGMLVADKETRNFTLANRAIQKMLGYSEEELLQLAILDIHPAAHVHWIEQAFERATRGATGFINNVPVQRKDGTVFYADISAAKIRLRSRDQALGIFRDITERRKAEEERERLEVRERQLQKSESLERMAGAIAHHFNNQLQGVLGNLEVALSDPPPNAELAECLTGALTSARKAAEVSRQMLDYLGPATGKREPIALGATCLRSLSLLRSILLQDMVLDTDLPSPDPTVSVDANQLHQVLTSLLNNASEASAHRRGTIRLTVKVVHSSDIPRVHLFPVDWHPEQTAYACLEVADTGCGIPAEHIERLFEPFFSTKSLGRGLGLSVVLGILRAHNGAIAVESQLGQGTTFRVFLPLSSVAAQPVRAVQAPKPARGGAVLVVEDDPVVRKLAALAIKRVGFIVLVAEDGIEALEVFQQHQDTIVCVLCDVAMPRRNGWETLAALRRLAPDIPVILSSGHSEAQTMAGHHAALPQAFLSKPYDLKTLGDTIARAISSKQPAP